MSISNLDSIPEDPYSLGQNPLNQRQTRKCPYCAEEILEGAIVCKHCGRDLTQPPQQDAQRRVELVQNLTQLETNLAAWERYLQEQIQKAQDAKHNASMALIGMIIGLFLTAIIFGILIFVIAAFRYASANSENAHCIKNQGTARLAIEQLRSQIANARNALAYGRDFVPALGLPKPQAVSAQTTPISSIANPLIVNDVSMAVKPTHDMAQQPQRTTPKSSFSPVALLITGGILLCVCGLGTVAIIGAVVSDQFAANPIPVTSTKTPAATVALTKIVAALPTSRQKGQTLGAQIDDAWSAGNWILVIALLKAQSPIDSDKLYSAHYNYGQSLLAQGNRTEAISQFNNALSVKPNGTEARNALISLTLSPVPPIPAKSTPVPATISGKLVVNAWEVVVTKVMFANSVTAFGRVEKARGRFAIVFVRVTNRGYSQDTFTAIGKIVLKDAGGSTYEESLIAEAVAREQFQSGYAANINPDTSGTTALVFDVSSSSSSYMLTPQGSLLKSGNGGISLPTN